MECEDCIAVPEETFYCSRFLFHSSGDLMEFSITIIQVSTAFDVSSKIFF